MISRVRNGFPPLIKHEQNDPRRGKREAAERSRQTRLTLYLAVAIGCLVCLIAFELYRRYGL